MADIFSDHEDPTRDLPKTRKIEVENGADFLIEQRDPYGFWFVRREKGQIPAKLSGAYTTYSFAQQAVERYVNSKENV